MTRSMVEQLPAGRNILNTPIEPSKGQQ